MTKRVVQRAQYEAFEFSVEDRGVRVRNGSHANPDEHEYLVRVEDGLPSDCECPANANYDGACKHRVAVAIRKPVLDAAIHQRIAADGGTAAGDSKMNEYASEDSTLSVPEDCDCAELSSDFPCWECVKMGRRDLPE